MVGLGLAVVLQGTAHAAVLELSEIEDVEELSLGELLEQPVVAASRYAQKPGSSPTLVSTIDADYIDRMGYRTLGEALRGVRGVYVSGDGNYTLIGLRGTSLPGDYNSRIALSIDDHGINDATFAQAAAGQELGLPMIAIDHIEMIRGGAWSLYGQSALLGAIQIVTASGESRPGLRVASTSRAWVETASDPAGRATIAPRGQDVSASYGAVTHGIDVFVAASYLLDRGLGTRYSPDLVAPAEICVDHLYRQRVCDGLVHVSETDEAASGYLVVRSHAWSLHALAARRIKHVATAPYGVLIDDPGSQTVDPRFYADVEYKRTTERSDVIARVAANAYPYSGTYAYDLPHPGYEALPASRALDLYASRSSWYTAELRGRYKIPKLGRYLSDIELAMSGELGRAYVRFKYFTDFTEGRVTNYDQHDLSRMAAVSAQGSVRAVERVVGFAAIRASYYPDSFGGTVNPQAGLVVDGGRIGRLRFSIAQGFRAPILYERAYASPDEALGPERSETREISLERYLGKHLRAQLVAYSQRMTDLITNVTVETGFPAYANRNGRLGEGIESELEGRWNAWRLRATYALQRSSDQDGNRPVHSPRSIAYGALLAPLFGGRADLALETFYIGPRATISGARDPAVLVTNLNVTARHLIDQVDVTLGVTNLFDRRDSDPAAQEHRQGLIPRDPRVVWLRLQLDLGR